MKHLLLVLTLLMVSGTMVLAQSDRSDRRTLHVVGTASTTVAPDQAVVTIGVATDGRTVKEAKQANDSRARAMLTRIANVGIPSKDVQTSGLIIEPIYDYQSDTRRLIKYTMSNTVTVVVRNLAKLEQLIDEAMADGGNMLSGVAFRVSNHEAIVDTLRIAAAKDAKVKADGIAQALDMKVARPITITVQQHIPDQPVSMRLFARSMAAEDASTPIQAGESTIRVSVDVTFEIE